MALDPDLEAFGHPSEAHWSENLKRHVWGMRRRCHDLQNEREWVGFLELSERQAKAIAEGDPLALAELQATVRTMLDWKVRCE